MREEKPVVSLEKSVLPLPDENARRAPARRRPRLPATLMSRSAAQLSAHCFATRHGSQE
jgi:hypothetical protein